MSSPVGVAGMGVRPSNSGQTAALSSTAIKEGQYSPYKEEIAPPSPMSLRCRGYYQMMGTAQFTPTYHTIWLETRISTSRKMSTHFTVSVNICKRFSSVPRASRLSWADGEGAQQERGLTLHRCDRKFPSQGQRDWRLSGEPMVERDPVSSWHFPEGILLPLKHPHRRGACLTAPRRGHPGLFPPPVSKPPSSNQTSLLYRCAPMEALRPGEPCCCRNHEVWEGRACLHTSHSL